MVRSDCQSQGAEQVGACEHSAEGSLRVACAQQRRVVRRQAIRDALWALPFFESMPEKAHYPKDLPVSPYTLSFGGGRFTP